MIEGENEFMTDVLFYQNYTYVADISAIVLCIICWLLLHSSYTVREKSLIIFKAGTVCLMMATVCSISFHTAITRITESRKILIYVLQDGEIMESGTHSELVAQNGIFARMWKNYSEAVEWKLAKEAKA